MATDPAQPDIGAALDALTSSVTDMQSRVTTDLTTLRDEVAAAQQQGQQVDAAMIVERLTTITQTVEQIDVTAVVQSGGGTPAPPADGGSTATATGDQGQPATDPADPNAGTEVPPAPAPGDAGAAQPGGTFDPNA